VWALHYLLKYIAGADPGFQAKGGVLKKIAPSGGRRENFGVFRVKNHDFTPKNHIFSNFRYMFVVHKYTSVNIEGAIKNGQSMNTRNIGYKWSRKQKQKYNKLCVGHNYAQTHKKDVHKTWALIQTTRGKDEPNIVLMRKS
jgi:hypothetical protein